MSQWTLRSAWDATPRHPWDVRVARCSECKKRVGTWLENDEAGRRIAKPCSHEQTSCQLRRWLSAGERVPLIHADGRVS